MANKAKVAVQKLSIEARRGFAGSTPNQQILSELARVRVLFQLRAVEAVIRGGVA